MADFIATRKQVLLGDGAMAPCLQRGGCRREKIRALDAFPSPGSARGAPAYFEAGSQVIWLTPWVPQR